MKHGQTRRQSLIEAWLNVLIGFAINYMANLIILPIFLGVEVPLVANLYIGLAFTVVSVARSYGVRRFFNYLHVRLHEND